MNFKPSLYNYFLNDGSEQVVAFNFLTRSMLSFTLDEYDKVDWILTQLDGENLSFLDDHIFKALLEHRFIINSNFDELEFFKFNYFRSLYDSSVLTTVLLPTLGCNFDCPYCFEYKKNIRMSEEIIASYIKWVKKRLPRHKHFHITWFGGEPLLCFDIIKRINREFLEFCNENKIGFSSSITTNGFLLTDDTIKELYDLKIFNVHVTFDGSKEFHDITRKTRGGKPTFDKLVSNVETYCSISQSHLPLSIRVNVTDDNLPFISDLFKSFSSQVKQKSRIYFRYVWSSEVCNYKVFSSYSQEKEAFDKLAQLYDEAAENGFHIDNPIDQLSFNYCEVDFANHFAIDPLGNIYLCGHTFKPEDSIGNISSDLSDERISEYCKWINTNPFNDSECVKCNILPLCKGSCRVSRFHGERSCIEEKYRIEDYIRNLYVGAATNETQFV